MEDVQEVETKLLEISLVSDAPSTQRLYVIVDTNVLLSNFSLLEELRMMPKAVELETVVIVPWIVLNELDKLKNSTLEETTAKGRTVNVGALARRAINLLLDANVSGDLFYRGETLIEYRKAKQMTTDFGLTTNDDKILQSCMYFGKMFLEHNPRGSIILLSNDKNLLLRARTNGIHAVDGKGISASRESVDSARLQATRQEDLFKSAMGLINSPQQVSSGSSVLYQPPGIQPQPANAPPNPTVANGANPVESDAMVIDNPSDDHWGYNTNRRGDTMSPHSSVPRETKARGGRNSVTSSVHSDRSRNADNMQIVMASSFQPRPQQFRGGARMPGGFHGQGRFPRFRGEVKYTTPNSSAEKT